MSTEVRYGRTGRTYSTTRQPDVRIAAVINEALDGMETVANIGAGSGSYEPAATVVAVEPSRVMIAQRPSGSAPTLQAVAERLAIRSKALDAALAVLTVHHWGNLDQGVSEMLRIARRRVVIFTWDHEIFQQFWLVRDYLPAAAKIDVDLGVPMTNLMALLGNPAMIPVPVPHDCVDGFGGAYWRRPHAYLDPVVQAGMSMCALAPKPALREGVSRLRADIESGEWVRRYGDLMDKEQLDLGYRLLIAEQ
jgi:SAM-dependent methyltransferase